MRDEEEIMRDAVLEQLERYREQVRAFIAAIAAHAEARLAYEAALDALEDARARAVREGLQGRNEDQRRAELLERTRPEEERVRSARMVLRVAEANLEMTRAVERVEREALRALYALAGAGEGAAGAPA